MPPSQPPPPRQDSEASQTPSRWYDVGFRFTPRQALILLGLLTVGVGFSYLLDAIVSRFVDLDAENVQRWIAGFGPFAPLVYIGLLASTIIFTPLPSVPVDIAGGLAFGLIRGTIFTLAGAMIGATINFYVARRLGRRFVERRLGSAAMAQIDNMAERMGARLIFLTRLIPLFNFDWVSYAAGLTRMRFRTYALASIGGILPPIIGIVYVGDVLLSDPQRSRLVFTGLVIWSAVPPVVFLVWIGVQAVRDRVRGGKATTPAASEPGPTE